MRVIYEGEHNDREELTDISGVVFYPEGYVVATTWAMDEIEINIESLIEIVD